MLRSSIGARLAGVGGAAILLAALLAQAAPTLATGPSSPGAPHKAALSVSAGRIAATAVSRGTVDVRAMAARPDKSLPFDPSTVAKALARVATVATAATRQAQAGAHPAVVGPPAPVLATASGQAAAATPLAATGQAEGDSGGIEPPDSGIAVGPDGTVEADNVALLFTDRAGTVTDKVFMPDFFLLPQASGFTSYDADPRIHFDTLRQRWIATDVSWDCATNYTLTGQAAPSFGHGFIDFAISRTADPHGAWDVSYFGQTDAFPDQPTFGASTDKLGLVATYFDMVTGSGPNSPDCLGGDFDQSIVYAMDWAQLPPKYEVSEVVSAGFTFSSALGLRLAVQEPVTTPELRLVNSFDATASVPPGTPTDVVYLSIAGSAARNTLLISGYDLTVDNVVAQFLTPPSPEQSGGTLTTAIDETPDSVIYHDGSLAFTANYPCTPTGDSTSRVCVRVVTLSDPAGTAEPTAVGDTLIATNGFDDSFGGIAYSGAGVLHVVYSRSSATSDAGSYDQYNLPTDAPTAWSTAKLLTAGAGTYAGTQWGAYLGVAQDPQDPSSVWVGDPYAAADHTWATSIHQVSVGAVGTKYNPITPVRVLDGRTPIGLSGPFVSGVPRTFAVANTGAIPADAVAITGNLTVTGQTAAGFASLTPTPTANPPSSTLNFPRGDTRANNVTIALAADGSLAAVYKATAGASAYLLLDVTGYFSTATGGKYQPVVPSRILDSRSDLTIHSFVANVPQSFAVRGDALLDPVITTIPADAIAITANLTVTGQTAAGFVSLTPDPTTTPATSTINFPLKDVRANGLTIPIAADGTIAAVFKAKAGQVDLALDVTGYYTASGGLLYYPLNPGRRVDTRTPVGFAGLGNGLAGIQGTTPRAVVVAGHDAVPASAVAITANLTVTGQTWPGFIAVTDVANPLPGTSTINFPLGDTRANGITAPLGSGTGELWFVYRSKAGKGTQLILDISGYFQ